MRFHDLTSDLEICLEWQESTHDELNLFSSVKGLIVSQERQGHLRLPRILGCRNMSMAA